MNIKILLFLGSCFPLLGICKTSISNDPNESLMNKLNQIQSYSAEFHQRIVGPSGGLISESKGQMAIERPGKFFWKSKAPDPLLVIADGQQLWTYDIELEQVTKQNLEKSLENSPAGLLAGETGQLDKEYQVSWGQQDDCLAKANQCYALAPKGQDAPFSKIFLGFLDNQLLEMKMVDMLGQKIRTLFYHNQINPTIEAKRFEFRPPPGVDVIEERQEF